MNGHERFESEFNVIARVGKSFRAFLLIRTLFIGQREPSFGAKWTVLIKMQFRSKVRF